MADDAQQNAETSAENSALNVFISAADTGTGLALVNQLVKAGHKVVGSVIHGSEGAFAVRKLGAVPAYADSTRTGEVRSAMQMAKADIVVHLMPTLLNTVPHARIDADALATMLADSADAVMEAAGKLGVKHVVSTSYAFLYGNGEHVDEKAALSRDNALFRKAADIEASIRDGGVPATILRTGYIYGTALKDIADAMIAGRAMPGGDKAAAWIHDIDLANAIFQVITQVSQVSEEDEAVETIYNVASDNTASPDAFIDAFSMALGLGEAVRISPITVRSRITPAQKTLLAYSVTLDSTKFKEATGWQPQLNEFGDGFDRAMMVWKAAEAPQTEPDNKPERAVIEY